MNDPASDKSNSNSYVVVARRYRPLSFQELVGQEHIAKALANAGTPIAAPPMSKPLIRRLRRFQRSSSSRVSAIGAGYHAPDDSALDCYNGP